MTRVAGKSPANGAAQTAEQAEKAARRAQARTSGAKSGDTITWKGETFRLEPGEMPGMAQMILTHFAAADPGTRDPEAEDGMWQLLEMLLAQPSGAPPGDPEFDVEKWDPGEFRRFRLHAGRTRASLEEIIEAMQAAVEVFAARPTGRRPGSSAGRPATTENSTETSSAEPAGDSSG
jgi:hypothetical protein